MVQIIQEGPRRQTFAQKLNIGVGRGLEQAQQLYNQYQQQQRMAQENEAAKRLGIDLSGIQDPKMRQEALSYALQGLNQQALEEQRQQGKRALLTEKLGAVGNLLSGQKGQMSGNSGQLGPQDSMTASDVQQQAFDPSQISDEQILQLSAIDPVLGREARMAKDSALKQKAKREEMDFQREKLARKEQTEVSKPVLLELNQSRKNIPLQEQAIIDIKEASPKVSALDYFADVTGFEPLRSAEGAKLKTGIKDFFLSDLTRAGTRPNQWIEQQLADALPKIGRSPEANLITAEGLQFKVDLAKKRIETIDRLAEQDREKFGFVKGDVDSRAAKEMKKYVVDRQKELHESIKKIKAQYNGKKNTVRVTSPEGSVYEISADDIDEAIENGYNISE